MKRNFFVKCIAVAVALVMVCGVLPFMSFASEAPEAKNQPGDAADIFPVGAFESSIYDINYTGSKAFDNNDQTRWNPQPYTFTNSYVGMNFGKTVKVDKIEILEVTPAEAAIARTLGYDLQYWDGSSWVTFDSGLALGTSYVTHNLQTPVEAQYIRFSLTDHTNDCVTISEIKFYYEGVQLEVPSTDPTCFASTRHQLAGYSAFEAFDGSYQTRWNAADGDVNNAFVGTTFASPVTIDRVIATEMLNRIQSFALQYLDENGQWATCFEGTTIGEVGVEVEFDPVTTTAFRLLITSATDICTLWEVELYNGDTKLIPGQAAVIDDTNLALHKGAVSSGSIFDTNWNWSSLNLTNGVLEENSGYTSFGAGINDGIFIGVDLSTRMVIDELVLFSSFGGAGNENWSGIPKSFDVEISSNGYDWNKVASFTNDCVDQRVPVSFKFDPVIARFVIIRSKELYPKADGNYIQLAEMQIYNNRAEELTCEETFEAHFQTRANGDNAHDARIILLTKPELLKAYDTLDVAITFTLTEGGTKVINGTLGGAASDYTLYKKITAGADQYKAADGAAIFGNIVTGIPNGAYSNVTVTITSGNDVLYEASLNG